MPDSCIHIADRDATYSGACSQATPAWRAPPPRSLDHWLNRYLAAQYTQALAEPLPAEMRRLLARLCGGR